MALENTVIQSADTLRLVQPASPEALEGVAGLLMEIAQGMRENKVFRESGEIKFNNDSISQMEILSDIKFRYIE